MSNSIGGWMGSNVGGASLAPVEQPVASEADSNAATGEGQAGSVLDVQLGGDAQARLAAMALQFASDRRESAAHQRDMTEASLARWEQQQVDLMRQKADMIRDSAATQLGLALLSSGAQAVAGLSGGNSTLSTIATADANNLQAAGKYLGTIETSRESRIDARVLDAEQRAGALERRLDDLAAERGESNDLTNATLDFLTEANKTAAETERALFIPA